MASVKNQQVLSDKRLLTTKSHTTTENFLMSDTRFAKLVVFTNASVPLVLLLWDLYRRNLGAIRREFVHADHWHADPDLSFLTLAVTPLRTSRLQLDRKSFAAAWLVRLFLRLRSFVYLRRVRPVL